MKGYVHARLSEQDRAVLEQLKQTTGQSESEILRRGLQLLAREVGSQPSALTLAAAGVGRFRRGPKDLSASARHLAQFGE
jgi:hypothetical protein